MGPKHGIARGVAVFQSPSALGQEIIEGSLGDSGRLREWSRSQGVELSDDSSSLAVLDSHLDEWLADQSHHEQVDLANESGVYLGNVIATNISGARWKVWPNGHPVISLASGRDLDVIEMVTERLLGSGSSLSSIFDMASSG